MGYYTVSLFHGQPAVFSYMSTPLTDRVLPISAAARNPITLRDVYFHAQREGVVQGPATMSCVPCTFNICNATRYSANLESECEWVGGPVPGGTVLKPVNKKCNLNGLDVNKMKAMLHDKNQNRPAP